MKKIILVTLLLITVNAAFISSSFGAPAALNENMKQDQQGSGYLVTAASVLNRIKENKETLIIDIRSATDFEKASIPHSINIPLFAIKTKAFLKDKEIFLINQGYNYHELENECSNLNKKGLNVRIIHGGMNSWKDAGGNIEGDAEAIKDLNKVSPLDVYLQENPESRLIINLSSSPYNKTDILIPAAISIPFDNGKTFRMRITEILNKNMDNKFLSILIFNQVGEQYEKIEEVLKKTGANNVFYLEGGLKSYRKFLNTQSMMSKREKISSESPNQCCTYE